MNLEAIQKPIQPTATFVYETPLSAMISVAFGITALALFPEVSVPLLGIGVSITLTRLIVKVMDTYDPKSMIKINEWIERVDKRFGYIVHVSFAVSLLAALIIPSLALVIAINIGIYKGAVAEIEINRLKQDQRVDGSHLGFSHQPQIVKIF